MAYSITNINDYMKRLRACDVHSFQNVNTSYRDFLTSVKVNRFRHIRGLEISFDSPDHYCWRKQNWENQYIVTHIM